MCFFRKKDPLPLYMSGKINEYRFINALKKLKPEDTSDFNLEAWRDFILEKCQISEGYFQILKYLEPMVSLIKREDLLSDIAIRGYGDDIINTDAVRNIESQETLQKILEYFNTESPFHIYTPYNGKFSYDTYAWTPNYRGGRLMYVLLGRIDAKHFEAARIKCENKMKWLDDIKSDRVKNWSFYEDGNYGLKFQDIYTLAKQRGFLE